MVEEEITALEALGIAIRGEIDVQEVYRDLAAMCEDETRRDRFLNLQQEGKRHQVLLENKYREMFPDVPLRLPESQLPRHAMDSGARKGLEIREVLSIALGEEKRNREFFLDCAAVTGESSGKRMFRFLADMAFSHQVMLAAELELLEKYPTYFQGEKPWDVESGLRSDRMKR
jgi:rubrerythrin